MWQSDWVVADLTQNNSAHRETERNIHHILSFFLPSFPSFLLCVCVLSLSLSLSLSLVCLDELVHQLGLRLELGDEEAQKEREREKDFFNCTFSFNSPCPAYQISLEDQQFHGIRTRRRRHRKQQQHLGLGDQLTDMWIAMGWLESVSNPAAIGTNQGSHVY